MKWSYPSNNNGDINGISNSGVETFQGTPLKSLAREICQNSLDAAVDGAAAVEVEFKPFILDYEEFPDMDSLKAAFLAALEFWKLQKSTKAQDFFSRAIKMMDVGVIPCLRISDFHTTGLTGSDGEYNTPWCNLTKSSGASDKAGTSGGSFGIGKFAPFACSELRTVFYSTLDVESKTAFQGISRITSFRRAEDNEITVGVGYYGDTNNMPIHTQLSLDPNYKRQPGQTGTDIFVSGFTYTDWKTDVIASVLDGFLYSVYRGSLIVRVDNVLISKDTLPSLIEEYQSSLSENADKYFMVLTSQEATWYEANFKNYGTIRLGLIIKPDMHRKVAMIRKTGMKIMDRGNISGIIPFAGVMLIEGEKINDFLRGIENPQHTKWEPDRAGVNSANARLFVRDLINYIKDCLEKLKQEDASEEIDPSVGEYLPEEKDSDSLPDAKVEALTDKIAAIEKTVSVVRPSAKTMTQAGGNSLVDDDDGEIIEVDRDGGAGHSGGNSSRRGSGKGDGDGDGEGTKPKEHSKHAVSIVPAKVRSVCLNKSAGEYSITFVPTVSSEAGELALFLSAETQNYEAPLVSAMAIGQADLSISGNRIRGLRFVANTPVRLKVNIAFYDFCSMEVKGYGN